MNQLLDTAQKLYDHGLCIIPVSTDGAKRPGLTSWKQYQQQRPTYDQVTDWFTSGNYDGLGVVTGAISGNLEMVEFEGRAIDEGALSKLMDYANGDDLSDLINRLLHGYCETTPSGGIHILYWISNGQANGNTKFARNKDNEVLSESRGEGGFVVIAPSAGRTHPSGKPWALDAGCAGIPATITSDERDRLWALLARFDASPVIEPYKSTSAPHDPTNGLRPGDDFNNKASWDDILTPHGWSLAFKMKQGYAWRRPGRDSGMSAYTGYSDKGDYLYAFSTSTIFDEQKPYTKFAAYALLEHGGDYGKAASKLRSEGYGDEFEHPKMGEFVYTPTATEDESKSNDVGRSRRIILTSAASIVPQRVHWLWQDRLALGTLGLLAGREGEGKSTVTSWLIAQITKGLLPGEFEGNPRSVLIAATEDSWSHTIVPRLMAANADLDKVFRVDVVLDEVSHGSLSLPDDLPKLKDEALEVGAALMVLDPLTSRLADNLDTHKDSDTRRALEPLVKLADDIDMAILGLMHFNKSGKTNPLDAVMASRAFTAVARSVHTVVKDPDDQVRVFATPKNNLGRSDLPMLGFDIVGHCIDTAEGGAWTSKIAWGEEREGNVDDLMLRSSVPGDRTATQEAAEWVTDYLVTQGGTDKSAEIKRLGIKAGHSVDAIKRARARLGLIVESADFPRCTYWSLKPESESENSGSTVGGDIFNAPTAPTGEKYDPLAQSVQSEQLETPLLALLQPAQVSNWVAS